MNEIQINFADFVQIQEAQPVTNSKFVAEAFGKRHDNVIAKIDELKAEIPASFHILNFKEMEIETEIGLGKTRKAKAYELTKDGFMLLVMGFTGKAAMQIKIAYIEAFNAMAEKLKQLAVSGSLKLSPAQKQQIQQAVMARHHRTGEHWQEIYRKLHSFCQVNSYHEIPAADFDRALGYLNSIQDAPEVFRQPEAAKLRNLKAALHHGLYCAEFIYRHSEALRGLNRRLAAGIHDHATAACASIRSVAGQSETPLPDGRYFEHFPWDGDCRDKARYNALFI